MPNGVIGYPSSHLSTLAFLLLLLFCFFPGTFLPLLYSPLSIFSAQAPSKSATKQLITQHPAEAMGQTAWFQKTLHLPAKARGSYLVTDSIVNQLPELRQYKVGILHLFAQHTSCALSMNENWDEDVRADMSDALDRIVPDEPEGGYRHNSEGSDDMPAHVKAALIGSSVSVPIKDGKLATGTWQGIWYLEFRTARHSRTLMATIHGEKT